MPQHNNCEIRIWGRTASAPLWMLDADITLEVVPPQLETIETCGSVRLQRTRNTSTWERAPYSASHLTLDADITLTLVPPQLETFANAWLNHLGETW